MNFLLIASLTWIPSLSGDPVVPSDPVPVKLLQKWKPIHPEGLSCPTPYPIPETFKKQVPGKVQVFSSEDHTRIVEGYLCKKMKYTVFCRTNWANAKSYQRVIETTSITPSECLNELTSRTEFEPGYVVNPYFPSPYCYYKFLQSNTEEASEEFIHIERLGVHLDPYKMVVLHPYFISGVCRSNMCITIFHGVSWVSPKELKATCPKFENQTATIFFPGIDSKGPGYLHVTDMFSGFFSEMCRIEYCGHEGYRTGDSRFFMLTYPHASDFNTWINLLRLEKCTGGQLVGAPSVEGRIQQAKEVAELEEVVRDCEMVKSIILSTGKISRRELSYFTPLWAGIHYSYRVNQGGILESALTEYKGLTKIYNTVTKEGEIGTDNMSVKIKPIYNEWTLGANWTDNRYCNTTLPNGISISKNCLVILPFAELFKEMREESEMVREDLVMEIHPLLEIVSNETNFDKIHIHPRNGGKVDLDFMKGFLDSIFGKIIITGIVIACIFVFLWFCGPCVLRCCCTCRKKISRTVKRRRNRTPNREEEEVEYVPLNTRSERNWF